MEKCFKCGNEVDIGDKKIWIDYDSDLILCKTCNREIRALGFNRNVG